MNKLYLALSGIAVALAYSACNPVDPKLPQPYVQCRGNVCTTLYRSYTPTLSTPAAFALADNGNGGMTGTDENSGRDLISDQAANEQAALTAQGRAFAQEHGLTEAVGSEIAQSFHDWEILGKSRARTQEDVADYTRKIFGVEIRDFHQATERAAQGDSRALDELNCAVATYWGTTPETTSKILTEWYSEKTR